MIRRTSATAAGSRNSPAGLLSAQPSPRSDDRFTQPISLCGASFPGNDRHPHDPLAAPARSADKAAILRLYGPADSTLKCIVIRYIRAVENEHVKV